MADENQELQQLAQSVRNAMQGLDDATKNAGVGLDAFTKELKTVPGQVARGMGNFAKSVGQGDTSFKALNSVVDLAANAMAGLAKSIPFAGEALSAGIKATAEASKFMLEQMDQSTKAFNDLSKVGALTASGMSGLQKQFTTSGLQLNTFVKQISENSVALARFRGLTGEGAEDFSKITGELTRGTDDSLRQLGFSAEEIGTSVGAFVTQQTRLGRSQAMTNAELTEGSKRYAYELDSLSKVTGLSRDAIQKQQDAALSESRFRASINSLNKDQQDGLIRLQTVMTGFGQELGQGTRDLVSGAANTDSARKLMADTGGAAADIIARLKEGNITAQQAQVEMQKAVQNNLKAAEGYSQFVDGSASQFGNFANKADFAAAKVDESGNIAKKTQKEQTSGADDLTNSTVKAQKSMEGLNIEIQKLGFTFLPKAADAVAAMTKSMETFVKYVNKTIGGSGAEGGGGGGGGGGSGVGAEFGGDPIGAGDAAAIGGVASDAEIAAAKKSVAGGGPPALNLKEFIKFTGGTGDEAHFNQLKPHVQDGFMRMAQDYYNLTGKKLQVNSAYRSPDEQAGVDPGANPKAAPGMSKHNYGLALDIQSDQRAYLEKSGLLSTYGFSPLANDPPHISAANGAILSGPTSGYRPNLTMHGTEAIVPLNSPAAQGTGMGGMDLSMLTAQLGKMDEMVSVLKSQLGVSEKLLKYQS
jgi:uncharacterized protein YcbK (DUF882 family)